jgi:hypothetical protein
VREINPEIKINEDMSNFIKYLLNKQQITRKSHKNTIHRDNSNDDDEMMGIKDCGNLEKNIYNMKISLNFI